MSDFSDDTFVGKCARGEVLLDEIDDFIEEWHEGEHEEKLHGFLGMTLKEYSLWVADHDVLPFIITARIERRDIEELLDELRRLPLAARSDKPEKAIILMEWLKSRGKKLERLP